MTNGFLGSTDDFSTVFKGTYLADAGVHTAWGTETGPSMMAGGQKSYNIPPSIFSAVAQPFGANQPPRSATDSWRLQVANSWPDRLSQGIDWQPTDSGLPNVPSLPSEEPSFGLASLPSRHSLGERVSLASKQMALSVLDILNTKPPGPPDDTAPADAPPLRSAAPPARSPRGILRDQPAFPARARAAGPARAVAAAARAHGQRPPPGASTRQFACTRSAAAAPAVHPTAGGDQQVLFCQGAAPDAPLHLPQPAGVRLRAPPGAGGTPRPPLPHAARAAAGAARGELPDPPHHGQDPAQRLGGNALSRQRLAQRPSGAAPARRPPPSLARSLRAPRRKQPLPPPRRPLVTPLIKPLAEEAKNFLARKQKVHCTR